jgi:DNA-binding response OmpR family regulator
MALSRPSVLIADDDPDIRDLVVFKLQQAGLDVVAVEDGNAALEALAQQRPDLVLLDVMMPGLSGLDVLRHIRGDEQLRMLKVVLLTARARDVDVDDGFTSGADDYVTKPFSPRELMHRVNSLLGRGR